LLARIDSTEFFTIVLFLSTGDYLAKL